MSALGTTKLTIMIDSVERACEVSVAEITNAETESDFVSFCDAAGGGGRDWALHIVAVQDPGDPDSIWNLIWDMSGTEVDVLVRPYGNAVASATEPHFSGTATVHYPDGVVLGGEADASTSARMTLEAEWPFNEKPTRIVS